MKSHTTSLLGVIILEPLVFKDQRGIFFESWKANEYANLGTGFFQQDNVSISSKNVLRGLHYQKHQGQLVTVLKGEILDFIVDLRPSSLTFKQHLCLRLSEENVQQVYMPPGCAHGFVVNSDYTVMNYKCTQRYDPKDELHIKWNDPDLAIAWPEGDFIISDKDSQGSALKDVLHLLNEH